MRSMLAAVGFVLLGTTASAVTIDPASNLYANTLMVRDHGTGFGGVLQLNSDHSYTAQVMQNGKPFQVSGTWALMADGATVCLSPTSVGAELSSLTSGCVALAGHNVGDRWSSSNDRNQPLDVLLSAGR